MDLLNLKVDSAERFYSDAYSSLREAWDKSKALDYANAVKAAQLCIELSTKGILELFDIDYPPRHEVSERLSSVSKKASGIPAYEIESLARVRVASVIWEPTHSFAVYGTMGVSANRLFKESDAKAAIEAANDAHNCLSGLAQLARSGKLKPRGG